jgi:hypothetical protein
MSQQNNLEKVELQGESFYKIANHDALRPFFMSIVSDANHWMFISSNGGLSAGRKNNQYSLFPYYTDDKITESSEVTGSKTILATQQGGKRVIWEPFSEKTKVLFNCTRNLYKNIYGNKVVFEEVNHDLGLLFRYRWSSSSEYGFVRQCELINQGDATRSVEVLDGVQNIIPYGVGADLQNSYSNLVDAYKKNELQPSTGLGIYMLSAIIVDRAEPSEALKANVVWSLGMEGSQKLISSLQLDTFRTSGTIAQELDVRGEKGAYFVNDSVELTAGESKRWMLVANVNQGPSQVADLDHMLSNPAGLEEKVLADIELGTQKLIGLVANADGLQCSEDQQRNSRHFANVMFNIMRGGIFDDGYWIEKKDFASYLQNANHKLYDQHKSALDGFEERFSLHQLRAFIAQSNDAHLSRLGVEYLPLKFSRRHGDPSRPWNRFSINTQSEIDGSKILDYEGNWRDIFQNWEALAHSYPDFIEGMIFKFLNATTFDGYNPYRVTKGGFDWEIIEPHDPWSYIGYWGDHQIIYLLKFLEFIEDHFPGNLHDYMTQDLFVYACVPYRIKAYSDIVEDPKETIDFDEEQDQWIRNRREEMGADGALLPHQGGDICQVNLLEKLLATVLAKCSNFVPEGGIWMNTQRPEWNDANNALVGNGLSMVTLYYLRRFLAFQKELLDKSNFTEAAVSEELHAFFSGISSALQANKGLLEGVISDSDRRQLMDALGQAASDYRLNIYDNGFSGKRKNLGMDELKEFTATMLAFLEHSIRANRRSDKLYHAYNLITLDQGSARVSYLSEMLEGQVAVLSSGYLSPDESLSVLDGLKASALFRPDQYSYILYPNKNLPRFVDKNTIPANRVNEIGLINSLINAGDRSVVEKDGRGDVHFNGGFNNAESLKTALDQLPQQFQAEVKSDRKALLAVFEEIFDHKSFTGRSGTFFGFEGLGSIYWHMVSKLLLAAQECTHDSYQKLGHSETTGKLIDHYYEILAGIGAHKAPALYGAFPTDPYSHTPAHRGAQQPGMTGQVKEDIIARFGELGISVREGELRFDPYLLNKQEVLSAPAEFEYVNVNGEVRRLALPAQSLGFTLCQVPVVYHFGANKGSVVQLANGEQKRFEGHQLDAETSRKLFLRDGVEQVEVYLS